MLLIPPGSSNLVREIELLRCARSDASRHDQSSN